MTKHKAVGKTQSPVRQARSSPGDLPQAQRGHTPAWRLATKPGRSGKIDRGLANRNMLRLQKNIIHLYGSSCDHCAHPIITQTHQELQALQPATDFLKPVLGNGQSHFITHAAGLSFAALYNYMLQLKSFNRITWDAVDINQCRGKASRPHGPQKLNSWETSPEQAPFCLTSSASFNMSSSNTESVRREIKRGWRLPKGSPGKCQGCPDGCCDRLLVV